MRRFLLFILIIALQLSNSYSQDDQITKDLPKLLGANNAGKEFWFSIPPSYQESNSGGFLRIYVTSTVATEVTVEIPGKGFIEKKITIPNGVIGFGLNQNLAPVTNFNCATEKSLIEKVYNNFGIHVYADAPIVVYCVSRYEANSDGFLAIPVASLGNEYIVSSYNDMGAMYSQFKNFPSITTITAAFDNTSVEFTLGGVVNGRTAGGMNPGETKQFNLNKGDVLMFMSDGEVGTAPDLSGSKINSNLPVAVVSGNHCANIPVDKQWCDYICEMDVPTNTWGLNYPVTEIVPRKNSQLLRIYAKEDSTKLYKNGVPFGFIKKGSGIIGEGYIEIRMNNNKIQEAAMISGDKPINVVLLNPSASDDDIFNNDPFMMNITPINQFQTEIVFCTPKEPNSLGFMNQYLSIIYPVDNNGELSDDFMFGEYDNGQYVWKKLNMVGIEIEKIIPYPINGVTYANRVIQLQRDGVYRVKAQNKFACYSYGFNPYDSYGYPTSSAFKDLSVDDAYAPIPAFNVDSKGDVIGAEVTDMPNDEKFRSNLSDIFLIPEKSSNYQLDYNKIVPGIDRKANWSLKVIDKSKPAEALVLFSDRCGNDTVLVFSYNPTSISEESTVKAINITPNPADKSIDISLNGILIDEDFEFNIIDISGKTLISGRYNAKNISVDVSNLPIGEYMLVMSSKSKSVSQKLIINR